jgi:hypothetical protein
MSIVYKPDFINISFPKGWDTYFDSTQEPKGHFHHNMSNNTYDVMDSGNPSSHYSMSDTYNTGSDGVAVHQNQQETRSKRVDVGEWNYHTAPTGFCSNYNLNTTVNIRSYSAKNSVEQVPNESKTTEPITLRCLCGHEESSHDRKLGLHIVQDVYCYPCRYCNCDFLIDTGAIPSIKAMLAQQVS